MLFLFSVIVVFIYKIMKLLCLCRGGSLGYPSDKVGSTIKKVLVSSGDLFLIVLLPGMVSYLFSLDSF